MGHTWDSFDHVMFKVIWGHLVHFRFFQKYDSFAASSTLMILFHPNFIYIPVTVHRKVTS